MLLEKLGGLKMAENVNDLEQVKMRLQGEIDTLEEKYSALSQGIESLESSKTVIKDSLKEVMDEFTQTNENVKSILERLDKLSKDIENTMDTKSEQDEKQNMFFQNIFKNPIRRLAVGAMSGFYVLADKTIQGTSSIRGGLCDIVSEAKTQNEKRRSSTYEQG